MGINIEIVEPTWYKSTLGVDVPLQIYQLLQKYNISTIANATKNKIPVILSSLDSGTL